MKTHPRRCRPMSKPAPRLELAPRPPRISPSGAHWRDPVAHPGCEFPSASFAAIDRSRSAVKSSAGKNVSTAISDSVMSTGVPKIIVVEMKLSTSSSSRIRNGIATLSAVSERRARGDRLGFQLVIECHQFRIRAVALALAEPAMLQQMRAPFAEIDGARRQRFGMER